MVEILLFLEKVINNSSKNSKIQIDSINRTLMIQKEKLEEVRSKQKYKFIYFLNIDWCLFLYELRYYSLDRPTDWSRYLSFACMPKYSYSISIPRRSMYIMFVTFLPLFINNYHYYVSSPPTNYYESPGSKLIGACNHDN